MGVAEGTVDGGYPPQTRQTLAEDGYLLNYRVWTSSAPSTTLVLLNGIMSHALWFHPLVPPLLQENLHIVGADRRGSGANWQDRGDAPTAKTLVNDTAQIIHAEHNSSRRLAIVGWCWGAVLAIHVARHLGEAVDRLAFVAPGLFPSEEVKARARKIADKSDGPLESPVQEDMFTNGPYLEHFILNDDQRLRTITRRFFDMMSRMSISATAKLSRLDMPILVLLADEDRATDNARTMDVFRALPQTTLGRIHAGHGVQFDAPDETADRILSWLRTRSETT